MSQQSKYKNFPDWKYGYTLGPPSVNNGGNYTIFDSSTTKDTNAVDKEITLDDDGKKSDKSNNIESIKGRTTNDEACPNTISPNDDSNEPNRIEADIKQDEEKELSLEEILKGQNPIMYCNEQSRVIKRTILFQPISESGPPHDKTFVFCCQLEGTNEDTPSNDTPEKKQGVKTYGTDKTKKGAKTKAAEEMVKHVYKLIDNVKTERKRSWWDSEYDRTLNNLIKAPNKLNFYNECDRSPVQVPPSSDKAIDIIKDTDNVESKRQKLDKPIVKPPQSTDDPILGANVPKIESPGLISQPNPSPQNNPISKLYEHCKKFNLSDPLFELAEENVLEQKRTNQGSFFKKAEYTMQCEVFGKKFYGKGFSKKEAKKIAAADAWNHLIAANNGDTIDQSKKQSSQGLTVGEMIAQAKLQHQIKKD